MWGKGNINNRFRKKILKHIFTFLFPFFATVSYKNCFTFYSYSRFFLFLVEEFKLAGVAS